MVSPTRVQVYVDELYKERRGLPLWIPCVPRPRPS
jgi:hypothetical protein